MRRPDHRPPLENFRGVSAMRKTPNSPLPAPKRRIVQVLADTRGVVGILFALAMPVLIGFTALGTEVGLWYLERRNLQTAADIGAIAAAFEVLNGTGDAEASAEREAVRHGLSLPGGTV